VQLDIMTNDTPKESKESEDSGNININVFFLGNRVNPNENKLYGFFNGKIDNDVAYFGVFPPHKWAE